MKEGTLKASEHSVGDRLAIRAKDHDGNYHYTTVTITRIEGDTMTLVGRFSEGFNGPLDFELVCDKDIMDDPTPQPDPSP